MTSRTLVRYDLTLTAMGDHCGRWVVIVTDLKNMADRQEWKKGKDSKKYM